MAAFFSSLNRTILAGIVITLVMMGVAGTFGRMGDHGWWTFCMRWLHIGSGVMWIGLLWYFNFVQTPSMPKIPDEQKPAVSKVIAPTALFWFRWAALATVVTGALLAAMNGYIVQALSIQPPVQAIGVGMWLALVMAFNVWFIIWPNQKKALGIVTVDATRQGGGRENGRHDLAHQQPCCRIPMLYCMAAQSHGGSSQAQAGAQKFSCRVARSVRGSTGWKWMSLTPACRLASQARGVEVVDVARLAVEQVEDIEAEPQVLIDLPARRAGRRARWPPTLRIVLGERARAEVAPLQRAEPAVPVGHVSGPSRPPCRSSPGCGCPRGRPR
jgi:hypothetical protein